MHSTIVHNLNDPDWTAIYSLPPAEAVRNAHAQYGLKDWNTWDYAKYDHLITLGRYHVFCGDYAAILPKPIPVKA